MNKYLKISMRMAIILGLFLPALETIRRIHQILVPEYFFRWFDDYTLGGVLLIAAYMVSRKRNNSNEYLIAAWGMAAGALTLSLYGQMDDYMHGLPDSGIFSSGLVTVAKASILAYILTGLYYGIRASKERNNSTI
jgi:hypothetical protein